MSRFEDGCYGSLKGVALIGKVLAGRCKMHYTRVAVGKGTIPEGMTPKTLEEPPEYVMDAMISSVTNPVDGECQVSVQIDSAAVETGFYATGLQLYAEDPDEGEIPYTYLVLENEPEWIRPASSIVGKLAYFDIIAAVGDVDKVYATIDPDALVTRAAALQMLTEHDADPDAHPDIVRSIMMGALALPLTADTGEALLTSSGRPIHAVYELERALSSKAELGRNSRNILINWDFRRPVNQNGGTRYTESGYTIDRWKIVNGGLSLGDDGAVSLLKNADTGTPRNCLFQLIDTPETYVGRTLTFSVLCKDLQGTLFATAYANKGGTADSGVTGASISSDGLASVTFTIAEDSAPTEFRVHWLLSPGGSCVPIAAKLELGERQTLARQVDGGWGLIDPLDYDLQYALCSQYSQITGARVEDRYINEDLFDNSYFLDPINQSDKTEYTGTGYGIDRWYCSMVQVTAEGIRSMDRGAYIQQKLDGPVKDLLAGREITISLSLIHI